MKRTILALALMATLAACKKNSEEIPNPVPEEKLSPDIAFTVKGATQDTQPLYPSSTTFNFLGFGYDVTDKFNDLSSVRANVVDISAYDADRKYNVVSIRGTESSWRTIQAESAVDLSTKFSNSYNTTKGLKLFGNTINQVFPGTDATDKKYVYGHYSYYMIWKVYKFYYEQSVNNFLTADFKRDITLLSAQELVNKYGTHVLTNIKIGSKFDVVYQAEAPQNERRGAIIMEGLRYTLKRTFGLPTGYLDEPILRNLNDNTSAQIYYSSTGGDISKLKPETINNRVIVNLNNWVASTTEDKATFIGASDDGLAPLYSFIDNAAKKAEVKAYLDQYYAAKTVKLTN
ncbi:MAC/perforin domain-containing protein [Pedobacter jeongneungensis]|uniref:MAC/perforin domain-containing protein n=1 Tax=Pedobacter jeongneungensis TaxID=947309 RepID=UPI00046A6D66|nr:MAC/perforin domain-containing protein [Pedobacter jeongneungensis]